ncbi:unnamed protein product [marine sediment metagenome]|uniref:Uncharacterized protein n=1 Tax=marine sediment metagenome TaxID=412755 RepID=X1L0Y8_9ZZZZ
MGQIEYEVPVKNVAMAAGKIILTLGQEFSGIGMFPHDATIEITKTEFDTLNKPSVGDKIKIKLEK